MTPANPVIFRLVRTYGDMQAQQINEGVEKE